jgi:DNA-binding HxlR family transcriptional regulator
MVNDALLDRSLKANRTERPMNAYSSYCPIAKAAEVLTERWTLLLVRDLMLGARHFNDFRRSIPLMTPALLSKRLKSLEAAGVVRHVRSARNGGWEYELTKAGTELKAVLDAAGEWGQRWVRSELVKGELHPGTLMWDIHRFMKPEHLPAQRTVLHVEFTDLSKMRLWWLVAEAREVDVCLQDPGHEVDLTIQCTLLSLTQVFMGELSIDRARTSGKLKIAGNSKLIRTMPRWFGLMPFSAVKPGVEQK